MAIIYIKYYFGTYINFTVRSKLKSQHREKNTKSISSHSIFNSPFFSFLFTTVSSLLFYFSCQKKLSYVATLLIKLIPSNEIRNPSAHTNNITSSLTEKKKIKSTYSIHIMHICFFYTRKKLSEGKLFWTTKKSTGHNFSFLCFFKKKKCILLYTWLCYFILDIKMEK